MTDNVTSIKQKPSKQFKRIDLTDAKEFDRLDRIDSRHMIRVCEGLLMAENELPKDGGRVDVFREMISNVTHCYPVRRHEARWLAYALFKKGDDVQSLFDRICAYLDELEKRGESP